MKPLPPATPAPGRATFGQEFVAYRQTIATDLSTRATDAAGDPALSKVRHCGDRFQGDISAGRDTTATSASRGLLLSARRR